MSLRHVLLVYLESGAAAGYDIVKGFQHTYGYLWNASYQQIYRDLGKLHVDGLVDCETLANGPRPARKVYRLNPRGRAAMQAWLATPLKLPHVNDPFLVKLASVHLLERGKFIEELRGQRAGYQAALKDLRNNCRFFEALPDDFRRKVGGFHLTLKRGLRIVETWLEWADEVEEFLTTTEPVEITPADAQQLNRMLFAMHPDLAAPARKKRGG
jgi:PadR family transcriptional regulator AphA